MMMAVCNICGGTEFEAGPNGRLTPVGGPVRCSSCRSLERHRSFRECLSRVPRDFLAWRRAIQFAPDPSLDPSWFHSYEASQYGGDNSIDLQEIDRAANSFDFISLSSVLEFVLNDKQAFAELVRISAPSCIIHCTFTPAAKDEATYTYEKPHGTFGRYHHYGEDLGEWFSIQSHCLTMLMVTAMDRVTGVADPIHFFCRKGSDADVLRTAFVTREPAFPVTVHPSSGA